MTTCTGPNCRRDRVLTRLGIVHAMCADHERAALSAFGGERWRHLDSTHEARADVLRTAVVGGVPTSPVTTARSALEPRVVSPELPWVASAERAAVAAG